MDYTTEFHNLNKRITNIQDELKSLKEKHKESLKFTAKILDEAEKLGIGTLAINVKTEKIKSSLDHPFDTEANLFADDIIKYGKGSLSTYPAVWVLCKNTGITCGCGNSGQHQITSKAAAMLIDGVYQLKDGKWLKVE